MKVIITIITAGIILGIYIIYYTDWQVPDEIDTKTQIADNLKQIETAINKYIRLHKSLPEKTGDIDFSTVLTTPGNLIKSIEISSEGRGIIYITFAETETGGLSGNQLVLETDGSLYRKDTQGRDIKIIPVVKITSEEMIDIQPKHAVPVVKSTRPCRCDYDVVDERPLCSESAAFSATICSKPIPQPKSTQAQLPYAKFSCYSVNMPMNYLPDNCNVDIFWRDVLAQRQEKIEQMQSRKKEELLRKIEQMEEESRRRIEDEQVAKKRLRKRYERGLELWVPDNVPKILYETNATSWRSATFLSLPYSENTGFNEDIRKEIFNALSQIQDNYKEVNEINTGGVYSLMKISVYLTKEGKKKILESIPRLAESEIVYNFQSTGIAKLDQLNNKYDVESLTLYDNLLYVEFRKPLNVDYLIEEYKSLNEINEIDEVHKSFSRESVSIALKEKGDLWEFVFSRGWGDCLAGCINHRNYYFTYNRKNHRIAKGKETGDAYSLTPQPSGNECSLDIAGRGKYGKSCYDLKMVNWRSPIMIIVPVQGNSQKSFAISAREISEADYRIYCKLTDRCDSKRYHHDFSPLRNISLLEAEAYMEWLSELSGKTYRLPTAAEWEYAAWANGAQPEKKKFNCDWFSRETEEYPELLNRAKKLAKPGHTSSANEWGFRNYIGNVQEWVIDDSGELTARGGSFKDSPDECNISFKRPHTGKADDITGFRVVVTVDKEGT